MSPYTTQERIHESEPSCASAIDWIHRTVEHRKQRVAACLAEGPAEFERTRPPGYASLQWRCRRCHVLRRHHVT